MRQDFELRRAGTIGREAENRHEDRAAEDAGQHSREGGGAGRRLQEARKAMTRLKFHPREALPNTTALTRADALYVELSGPAREELGHAIAMFRAALETQDEEAIGALRERLVGLTAAMKR